MSSYLKVHDLTARKEAARSQLEGLRAEVAELRHLREQLDGLEQDRGAGAPAIDQATGDWFELLEAAPALRRTAFAPLLLEGLRLDAARMAAQGETKDGTSSSPEPAKKP
jgi:hypothetical protein